VRKVDPAKFEDRRCRILEAAGRCFQRDGFRGASIADICTEAGISPGHLYHYFASKETIIEAMTERALQQTNSRFDRMLAKPDIVQAFLDEIENGRLAREEERSPALLAEVIAEATRNPMVAAILHRWSAGLRDLLTEFVREGQNRGQVDTQLDPDIAAAILVNAIEGMTNLWLKDPKFDRHKGADMLKILVSRFLKPG
jgi:TetR/AcrR family transcriptional regulator, repressor for uid operon